MHVRVPRADTFQGQKYAAWVVLASHFPAIKVKRSRSKSCTRSRVLHAADWCASCHACALHFLAKLLESKTNLAESDAFKWLLTHSRLTFCSITDDPAFRRKRSISRLRRRYFRKTKLIKTVAVRQKTSISSRKWRASQACELIVEKFCGETRAIKQFVAAKRRNVCCRFSRES